MATRPEASTESSQTSRESKGSFPWDRTAFRQNVPQYMHSAFFWGPKTDATFGNCLGASHGRLGNFGHHITSEISAVQRGAEARMSVEAHFNQHTGQGGRAMKHHRITVVVAVVMRFFILADLDHQNQLTFTTITIAADRSEWSTTAKVSTQIG